MTMLDDDRLAALLGDAAAAFEVPLTGVDEILARAAGRQPAGIEGVGDGDVGLGGATAASPEADLAPGGWLHRLTGVAGRHRVLSVAAGLVVLLVLAGTLGALTLGPAQTTLTVGLPHRAASTLAPAPSTTTTTPSPSANLAQRGSSGTGAYGDAHTPVAGSPSQGTTTPTTTAPLPSGAVGQNAKIEQTGSLALTVGRGKLDPTVAQLTALAGANGGFVANSQTQSGAATGTTPSGSVTLQVPVQSFAAVLRSAQALGKTSDLTTKATDVTGQYVDLQSRITALQASRQQYLTILAKATTVGDVLAVQEQLDGIQSQIEQLQGQLQLLTSQTSYSTLTVTVSEGAPEPPPRPVPESGLVRAWHTSIGGFVSGVEGLIRLAGPLLFALLLVGVGLVGGRAGWRRYQRHNL
jgi:Domain of unknown function (DUF4349)